MRPMRMADCPLCRHRADGEGEAATLAHGDAGPEGLRGRPVGRGARALRRGIACRVGRVKTGRLRIALSTVTLAEVLTAPPWSWTRPAGQAARSRVTRIRRSSAERADCRGGRPAAGAISAAIARRHPVGYRARDRRLGAGHSRPRFLGGSGCQGAEVGRRPHPKLLQPELPERHDQLSGPAAESLESVMAVERLGCVVLGIDHQREHCHL